MNCSFLMAKIRLYRETAVVIGITRGLTLTWLKVLRRS
jgi:hypothetical protein